MIKYTAWCRTTPSALSTFVSTFVSALSTHAEKVSVVSCVQKQAVQRYGTKETNMHPDQMYELRQLRHRDLRIESELARVRRELTSVRTAWRSSWFMMWVRRLVVRQLRGMTVSQ